MQKDIDIVLDFETLDTADTAVLPSIGAVKCNLITGEILEKFHVQLDVQAQIDAGYTISASTLAFWLKQKDAGRQYIADILDYKTTTVSREVAFDMLHQFIKGSKNAFAWGNGATFDLGICIKQWGKDNLPWNFWSEMDVRSIVSFCKRVFNVDFKKSTPFEGVQHHPVDDAVHEATYLHEYFRYAGELMTNNAAMGDELDKLKEQIHLMETPIPTPETNVDLKIRHLYPGSPIHEIAAAKPFNETEEGKYLEEIAAHQRETSELRQALDKAYRRIMELENPAAGERNPLDELTAIDQELAADMKSFEDSTFDDVKLEGMTEEPAVPAKLLSLCLVGDFSTLTDKDWETLSGSIKQQFCETNDAGKADVIVARSQSDVSSLPDTVDENVVIVYLDEPLPGEIEYPTSGGRSVRQQVALQAYIALRDIMAQPAPHKGLPLIHVITGGASTSFGDELRRLHNIVCHATNETLPEGVKPAAYLYPRLTGLSEDIRKKCEGHGVPAISVGKSDYNIDRDKTAAHGFETDLRKFIVEAGVKK